MAKKRVVVTREKESGRNLSFKDLKTGENMSRSQFVKKIESGTYGDDYHVREINGIKTPVSKPDGNKENNLG